MKNLTRIMRILLIISLLLTPTLAREVGQIIYPLSLNGSLITKMIFDKCVSGNCVNGRGKIVYDDGDSYEGDFVNGKFEGQGTYTFKNGDYHAGAWKDGVRNGFAISYIKATNTTREGNWNDGLPVDATPAIVSLTSTTSITTPTAPKTGTLADCQSVISEGCRNYLLRSTAADILPQVRNSLIDDFNRLHAGNFSAELIEATGGILSVSFSENRSRPNQPAENLKWGESLKSVVKKYGEPLQISVDGNRVAHLYKHFQFGYLDNKLGAVKFSRDKTASEIAAEQTFNRKKLEAERIANLPENRAKRLNVAIQALDYNLDNYTYRINELIKSYNQSVASGGESSITKSLSRDIKTLQNEAIALIDSFFYKYKGQVNSKTKASLLESRKNFGGGELNPLPRQ